MATTPILGITLPASGATDQVPADMMTAFTAAEKFFVGRFASAADRDAKITSPVAGMTCWLDAPGDWYDFSAAAWRRRGRSKYITPVGWPNATIAGTNNIVTPNMTINPSMGPYMISVALDVRTLFASGSVADVDLQLIQDGVVVKQRNIVAAPNEMPDNMIVASLPIPTGNSTVLAGKLVIPAGTTITTYADNRHSLLAAQVHPIYT